MSDSDECPICLEDKHTSPQERLPCGHVVCIRCISKLADKLESESESTSHARDMLQSQYISGEIDGESMRAAVRDAIDDVSRSITWRCPVCRGYHSPMRTDQVVRAYNSARSLYTYSIAWTQMNAGYIIQRQKEIESVQEYRKVAQIISYAVGDRRLEWLFRERKPFDEVMRLQTVPAIESVASWEIATRAQLVRLLFRPFPAYSQTVSEYIADLNKAIPPKVMQVTCHGLQCRMTETSAAGVLCDGCEKRVSDEMKWWACCSRCKQAWYCSTKCQTNHWKTNHKHVCKVLAEAKVDTMIATANIWKLKEIMQRIGTWCRPWSL